MIFEEFVVFTSPNHFSSSSSGRLRGLALVHRYDTMMVQFTECVSRAPVGTWVITLKPLTCSQGTTEAIVLRHETFFRMSWQMAKVFIYEKVVV